MKKLFFSLMALSMIMLTSCKKDNQSVTNETEKVNEDASVSAEQIGDVVDAAQDMASKLNVDIPQFSNPDVQKFAEDYGKYISQLMAVSSSGQTEKLDELMKQGLEYTKKADELTKSMTPEDKQKWTEWTNKLRSMVGQ